MDKYKCKKCGRVFLPCDLLRTKCSEIGVEIYYVEGCPVCMNEIPPVYSELERVELDG